MACCTWGEGGGRGDLEGGEQCLLPLVALEYFFGPRSGSHKAHLLGCPLCVCHAYARSSRSRCELPWTLSVIPLAHQQKKSYPRNRSRTSDLEISIVAIYSLPLCQLSYTRTYGSAGPGGQIPTYSHGPTMDQKKWFSCSLWGSNPRSYEHAP